MQSVPPDRLQPVHDLVEAARSQSGEFGALARAVFPDIDDVVVPRGGQGRARGRAAATASRGGPVTPGTTIFSDLGRHATVWEGTALFVLASAGAVEIVVDGGSPQPMARMGASPYLAYLHPVAPGRTHSFMYLVEGQAVASGDVPGYLAGSYDTAERPAGALSGRHQVASDVYPGAVTDYWVYTNAGVDDGRGAPVMVWHDGAGYVGPSDLVSHRLQIVSDNLVHQGLIPAMAHVLVAPSQPGRPLPVRYEGQSQATAMRGVQYDTVSELYGQHLLQEVLPAAGRLCRLRQDGYSRGSAGLSSGGNCAFTLSWLYPGQFSRAHCGIGSFTALLWDTDQGLDRGHMLPYWVRRGPARNIRVWLSDGAQDIEADPDGRPELFTAGSWPLANLQMASALKLAGYDFHFRYGTAGHNHAQTALDLPESLEWLWRGYDPDRTEARFEQDATERSLPAYRFGVTNRSAW